MKKRTMRQARITTLKCAVWLALFCWGAVPANAQTKGVETDLADRARPYERFIALAAARHGVDPSLLRVIGYLETRFNPRAVSKRGARGMMQFMPATATRYRLRNPHYPQASIDAAARYLRDLAFLFNHRADLVLAAYNAGEAAVEAYLKGRTVVAGGRVINPRGVVTGGVPPYRETRAYVARGMRLLQSLRSNSAAITQPADLKLEGNAEQYEKEGMQHSTVRQSVRAVNDSEQTEQSGVRRDGRKNTNQRSIHFGSRREEK